MRVLIHTGYFHPEIGSMRIASEISKYLSQHGYNVDIVTTFPRRSHTVESLHFNTRPFTREKIVGVNVTRLGFVPTRFGWIAAKLFELVLLPFIMLWGSFITPRPDLIMTYNNPLTLWTAGFFVSRFLRIPLVIRVDDIYPESLEELGLLRNKFAIACLSQLANLMYRVADRIIVHSIDHKRFLVAHRRVQPSRIFVIPLWADLSIIDQTKKQQLDTHSIGSAAKYFTVVFAGLMSFAQDLESILDAAFILRNEHRILFLLVGDGPCKRRLQRDARKRKLENVRFLPLQTSEKYFEIIRSASVCIVPLKKSLMLPVIPSKLIEIMACARAAIVIASPRNSALLNLVREANCGFFLKPNSPQRVAEVLLVMLKEPFVARELGNNGYQYAREHLSLDACGRLHEIMLEELLRENQVDYRFIREPST